MPPTANNTGDIVLEARSIVKTFPGVRALDRVDFELKRSEIHALVGENGAGKSTLIHILAGVHQPDSGQIRLDGSAVSFPDPHSAAAAGIAVVFQELSLVPGLSVAENIFAHRQPAGRLNLIDRKRLYEDTEKILRLFELKIDPRRQLGNLSTDEQQVMEILKAVSQNPGVLILDEPTSSLAGAQVKRLFGILKDLKAHGLSVIYISHHLPEVFEVADRITVLRDGKHVDTCLVEDVTEQDLVRKMVGREIVDMYGRRTKQPGRECFRVESAARGHDFRDITFSVRFGEIVGIAGLSGAGRTELARGIFGVEPFETGRMFLNNQPVEIRSPWQAINSRIGYLTEDRKEQGLFLEMTVRENCVAPSLRCFVNRLGLMDEKAITDFAEVNRARLSIVTPSVKQQVGNLSGGNQQKVLLSMWMGIQPLLLIVDEPTRGVDVGAKSEIYRLLRELAAQGVGIIMISSDLPEILGLSDRILVIRNGRLVGEFTAETATEENVIACASEVSLPGNNNLS
ncbi:MAG TPA: sugar ABC transporter ATP-binding protein [Sedimentisphaerales bacterium]|nr:sugar ABC transporter ATP-binding protein [Sedimentisphaerales bacterium]